MDCYFLGCLVNMMNIDCRNKSSAKDPYIPSEALKTSTKRKFLLDKIELS